MGGIARAGLARSLGLSLIFATGAAPAGLHGQASSLAMHTGGPTLDAKISRQAEADFRKFMEEANALPTPAETNERFASFMRSCQSLSQTRGG